MFPLAINLDNSLLLQPDFIRQFPVVEDMFLLGQQYRLFTCQPTVLRQVYRRLYEIRRKFPQPAIIFYGSGDLHHFTLPLVKTLPISLRPEVFVLIDNHPDWFFEHPRYHCGNWLSGLLRMQWIKKVFMIGMNSSDLVGFRFWPSPWEDLGNERVRLFPYRKKQVIVPFKKFKTASPTGAHDHLLGTKILFQTVEQTGASCLAKALAKEAAGKSVYISIDKDCLHPDYAVTNWQQGPMSLEELCDIIREFSINCNIVGMDICGEKAPEPIRETLKWIECMRLPFEWQTPESIYRTHQRNQATNFRILETATI